MLPLGLRRWAPCSSFLSSNLCREDPCPPGNPALWDQGEREKHASLRTGCDHAHLSLQAGQGLQRGWHAPERVRTGPAGPLGPGQTPGGIPGCSVRWRGPPGRAPWLCWSPSPGPCPAADPAWPCPAPAVVRQDLVSTQPVLWWLCAWDSQPTQVALPGQLLHEPEGLGRAPTHELCGTRCAASAPPSRFATS